MTNQTADIEAVIGRLEKLEKENRRLKHAGLAILLAVLLAGGAIAIRAANQPEPLQTLAVPTPQATNQEKIVAKEIEAQSFVVTGPDGKRRAFLGISRGNADMCLLGIYDDAGNPRLGMTADKAESKLFLDDGSKKSSIFMTTKEKGSYLSFMDLLGTRAELSLEKDGPRLTYWDLNGKKRCVLGLSQKFGGVLVLCGPDEKPVRSFTER